MIRHSLSLRSKTSITQKLPAQLEKKLEAFLNEVRVRRSENNYPIDLIINMDETLMYFDMVPQRVVTKKGVKELRVRSSGADKKRLTGNGKMLPSLAIFKGKRKLKFKSPDGVHVTVQPKAWMDSDIMLRWLKSSNPTIYKEKKVSPCIGFFSAHENDEFLKEARDNNVDVVVIPGGCTSKIQPLDVCLNKPFKSILRQSWLQYIESIVASDSNPSKLTTPSKAIVCEWIKSGMDYLMEHEVMVKKSFLVCGLTNALDGSENQFIHCAKELPDMQLPYVDESRDDLFQSSDDDASDDSEISNDSEISDDSEVNDDPEIC